MARAVCYLQIIPNLNFNGGKWKIQSIRVVSMTQTYPQSPAEGSRVVEVELEIPDEHLVPIAVRAIGDNLRLKEEYEATLKVTDPK